MYIRLSQMRREQAATYYMLGGVQLTPLVLSGVAPVERAAPNGFWVLTPADRQQDWR